MSFCKKYPCVERGLPSDAWCSQARAHARGSPRAVPPSWPVPRAVTASLPPTVCQAENSTTAGPVQAACARHACTSGTANRRLDTSAASTSHAMCPGAGGVACFALSLYSVARGSSAHHTASGAHNCRRGQQPWQGRDVRAPWMLRKESKAGTPSMLQLRTHGQGVGGRLAPCCRMSPDSQPRTLRRARKQTRLRRTPRPGAQAPTPCDLPGSVAAVRAPAGLLSR